MKLEDSDLDTLKDSFGKLDEFGFYVCPFCGSYAKEQCKISHRSNCIIQHLVYDDSEDPDCLDKDELSFEVDDIKSDLNDVIAKLDSLS